MISPAQSEPRLASREAACLAHDQNNLLLVAFEKMRMARIHAEGDPGLIGRIDELEKVLERMEMLNCAALAGAMASGSRELVDPDEVIDQAVDFARSLRAESFRVERHRGAQVRVPIHPNHLHQVALNLLKNAVEALPDRCGVVRVDTQLLSRSSQCFQGSWRSVFQLTVADNGPGIPEDVRRRIFQSGCSTKGKGHGLGLFHVREILGQYEGSLTLDSRPGQGTWAMAEWSYSALE